MGETQAAEAMTGWCGLRANLIWTTRNEEFGTDSGKRNDTRYFRIRNYSRILLHRPARIIRADTSKLPCFLGFFTRCLSWRVPYCPLFPQYSAPTRHLLGTFSAAFPNPRSADPALTPRRRWRRAA